jgi:ankyrin repeat protein
MKITELLDQAEQGYFIPCRKKNRAIDLFAKSFCGDTLLHVAVGRSNADEIKYLLKKGLDINARGDFRETPLFCAARSKADAIVDLLLSEGADPSIRSYWGDLPDINSNK